MENTTWCLFFIVFLQSSRINVRQKASIFRRFPHVSKETWDIAAKDKAWKGFNKVLWCKNAWKSETLPRCFASGRVEHLQKTSFSDLEKPPIAVKLSKQIPPQQILSPKNMQLKKKNTLCLFFFVCFFWPCQKLLKTDPKNTWSSPIIQKKPSESRFSKEVLNCQILKGSFVRVILFGQISIIPKPDFFRGFWGSSLIKPPFRVTSADVVIICPDFVCWMWPKWKPASGWVAP